MVYTVKTVHVAVNNYEFAKIQHFRVCFGGGAREEGSQRWSLKIVVNDPLLTCIFGAN